MTHETIETAEQLDVLCSELAGAGRIGVDTEFVSEDTYRPQLCLVQIATDDRLAVIDTMAVEDLTPFWSLLADGGLTTVVHAGREELGFCLTAVGRRPAQTFDTQIAAGLVGADYPAGYAALVSKFLGVKPGKGETRTDWRRRPLSDRQVRYAVEDVRYLLPLRDRLWGMLEDLGRCDWMTAEINAWQDDIEAARTQARWRNVSGTSGLSARCLAIVRELWMWREEEACTRDIRPKRVLRDDLIVEIARRKSADPTRIRSIRGLHRRLLNHDLPALVASAERGLDVPEDQLPKRLHRQRPAQLNLLSQFLTAALRSTCREAQIAPAIVGTVSNIHDLLIYRLGLDGKDSQGVPALARGWRKEVVGEVFDELLAGRTCIRIGDPLSDQPLEFEPVTPRPSADDRA